MGKIEKEIEAKIKQEEAISKFNEQLNTLKNKKDELVNMAVDAEIEGNVDMIDTISNSILGIQSTISSLQQAKLNFDLVTISANVSLALSSAFSALDYLSAGNINLPNYKKITNTQAKLARFLQKASIGQSLMSQGLKNSNPANKTLYSQSEKDALKSLINARVLQKTGINKSESSLADEIEKERLKN